jgi:hypothetical protein
VELPVPEPELEPESVAVAVAVALPVAVPCEVDDVGRAAAREMLVRLVATPKNDERNPRCDIPTAIPAAEHEAE